MSNSNFKMKYLFLFVSVFVIISFFALSRYIFSTPAMEKFVIESLFKNNKIAYFGDSTLYSNHKSISGESLGLADIFEKNIKIKTMEVSGAAYNPILYEKLLNAMYKINSSVQVAIIPINLRSFSSSWLDFPEYQFEQECSFLSIIYFDPNLNCIKDHLNNKFNPSFLNVKQKKYREESIPGVGFLKTTKRRIFFEKTCLIDRVNREFSCKNKNDFEQFLAYMSVGVPASQVMGILRYNYHYGEVINENNRALNSIKKISELALLYDKNIFFYFTPHNFEEVMKTSGEVIVNIMNDNINKIISILNNKKNIKVLDFSNLLDSSYFDLECRCEHIDSEGKKILSFQIIKALKDYNF